jgi:MOSC domain-containing protein YiiM
MNQSGQVVSVSASAAHDFTKRLQPGIDLIAGLGVAGDAHMGETVRHLYLVKKDPSQPNLRQVHLIHQELLDELRGAGFNVFPGAMGENITTCGVALLSLPTGTRLELGADAVVAVTGLRNPCRQLNDLQDGLMNAVLDRTEAGELIRKSGVMGIVLSSGTVRPGDEMRIVLPDGPHRPLQPV